MSRKENTASGRLGHLLAAAEWVLLLALLVLFVMRALVPGWRTLNTDFPNYYLTAAFRLQGTPADRAYEWIWLQRHKDHRELSQPLVGFVPNPPLCAAPLLPLPSVKALSAKRVWILLNLALLAAAWGLCIASPNFHGGACFLSPVCVYCRCARILPLASIIL